MAISTLASPVPVKFHRQATDTYWIWSGNFTDVPYNLNDPALGLGVSLNAVYGDSITVREITSGNDQHFQNLINFCTAQREVFIQAVADAVNAGP